MHGWLAREVQGGEADATDGAGVLDPSVPAAELGETLDAGQSERDSQHDQGRSVHAPPSGRLRAELGEGLRRRLLQVRGQLHELADPRRAEHGT